MKIDCKGMRELELLNIEYKVNELKQYGIKPKLLIIQSGDRLDSNKYVKNKISTLESIGISTQLIKIDNTKFTTEKSLFKHIAANIESANKDKHTHGIILQLPLVGLSNELSKVLLRRIDSRKDVDCLTPHNENLIYHNNAKVLPCTVSGIMALLEYMKINLSGKRVLVIGRSNIVGKPLALSLLNKDATVTIANSKTVNLKELVQSNEIIISCVGKINLITQDMVNENHILIDVGINFNSEGKMVGDVNHDCYDIVKAYTSVPGGVGILTTMSVAYNLLNLITGGKI